MSVDQFDNQWLSGSVSLKELSENWPASELKTSTKETIEMKTCQNTCCKLCSSYTKQWMVPWPQYLIWTKLTRLAAWIIRFLDNSRLMNEHWHFRSLSGNEIQGHPLSTYARFSEKLIANPDTYTYKWVSGGLQCYFFGKLRVRNYWMTL